MKLYKLYLLYDLSMLKKSEQFMTALILLPAMQLLTNRDSFGFVFLVGCNFLPLGLLEVFTSWKYQDKKQTEYFFSLPSSRTCVVMNGFLLALTSAVAVVFLCIFIDISGLAEKVHQYLGYILKTDFYTTTLERYKDVLFGIDKLPLYLLLAWAGTCSGCLPFLLVGPGLRRMMLRILVWGLTPLPGWIGVIYFTSQAWIALSVFAVFTSILFVLALLRFKKVQLTY